MKNPKSQIPNPKKIPNTKLQNQIPALAGFGIWNLGFVWDLGFGIWDFFRRPPTRRPHLPLRGGESASVLIIVLWIAFGLVSLALYFAGSMSYELRASENRVSAVMADTAIDGAARYLTSVLATLGTNGIVPDPTTYSNAAVSVGDAHFWLLGRDTNNPVGPGRLSFGLVDEASKLNLNKASSNQLIWLPRMTTELTSGILDWRSTNGPGTTEASYEMSQPAYQCKGAPFETVGELRLVYGANMDLLVGEDANRNGVLDANENDENQNGMLDPGILDYVTVYSCEPNTNNSSVGMVNISSLSSSPTNKLNFLLQTNFGTARATQILRALGLQSPGNSRPPTNSPAGTPPGNTGTTTVRFAGPLDFYVKSGMSSSEFALIFTNLTITTNSFIQGRVNVNTASAPVLTCLLGGDSGAAQQMVNYRQANPNNLTSIAWVIDALGQTYTSDLAALRAGDYITTRSYQFTADVAALGPHGRGYRRVRFIFDTSSGVPQIVYRQDQSHLGWALGKEIRQTWILAKQ